MRALDAQGTQRAHGVYLQAFVDELARSGVRDVCFAPGSRSTPLILTFARHPGFQLWTHIDERSAAFFALGLAKMDRRPVAVVCTSGTAAANFLPAVVEARYGRIPLLALTADRPHELRDRGAPQTIDQIHLFGTHVKWFQDVAPSGTSPGSLSYIRAVAARAAAAARAAPAGPVHLNFPFHEPLIPIPDLSHDAAPRHGDEMDGPGRGDHGGTGMDRGGETGIPATTVWEGVRTLPLQALANLAAQLRRVERGLLVCGPQHDPSLPSAVFPLAQRLGWPLLADPLSLVRCGCPDPQKIIDAYDAFLRDESFVEAHPPQMVLRLGAMPVSKAYEQYLARHPGCRHLVVDGGGAWPDPTGLATDVIHADPVALCTQLTEALDTFDIPVGANGAPVPSTGVRDAWRHTWMRANQLTRDAIQRIVSPRSPAVTDPVDARDQRFLAATSPEAPVGNESMADVGNSQGEPMFEGRVFSELAALLPPDAALFVSNSMPVRDLDTFFPATEHAVHLLANRGASGIDGIISSALGASAARQRTGSTSSLVLVVGDLSFYHDMNGLLAAKRHGLPLTIVLIHNDGGGIFSFLPQAEQVEGAVFEELFGTPTGLDFRPAVEMYGGRFISAPTWEAFRAGVRAGLTDAGLTVVEIKTSRAENVRQHREVWQAVSHALEVGLMGHLNSGRPGEDSFT